MAYTTAFRARSSDTSRDVRDSWSSEVTTVGNQVYAARSLWSGETPPQNGTTKVWTDSTTEPTNA